LSPKLPVVKARDVIQVAERIGFVYDRQKGSHAVYYRSEDRARIVIPVHQGKDKCIFDQALPGSMESC